MSVGECVCEQLGVASALQVMSNLKSQFGQDVEKQSIKLPKKWNDTNNKVKFICSTKFWSF